MPVQTKLINTQSYSDEYRGDFTVDTILTLSRKLIILGKWLGVVYM